MNDKILCGGADQCCVSKTGSYPMCNEWAKEGMKGTQFRALLEKSSFTSLYTLPFIVGGEETEFINTVPITDLCHL